jgi:aminopeptidase N
MARAEEAVRKYHALRPKPIIDPELTDLNAKLNAFNYQKGSWVLHMLRKVVGEAAFFDGIRRYYSLYAGGNASTEDFQRVMESVSGVSLQTFFRQWCYQPGWPEYEVSWQWDESAKDLAVKIRQTQTTGFFDMPVEISIQTGTEQTRHSVRVYAETGTFRFAASERPTGVQIDPEGWILKSVIYK